MDKANPKQDAIDALRILKESLGWKVIKKVLDANIKDIDSKLHGERDLEKDETIELLQKQWNDRKRMKTLPEDLIEEYGEKEGGLPKPLDPYF